MRTETLIRVLVTRENFYIAQHILAGRVLLIVAMMICNVVLAETTNIIKEQWLERAMQEITRENMDVINQITDRIKDGTLTETDGRKLGRILKILPQGNVLHGKTAVERQRVIMDILGKTNYEAIREYYTARCTVIDPQKSDKSEIGFEMIDALGCRLFSIESREVFLAFLLSPDPNLQYGAAVSLAAIGENGAYNLLRYMLLSKLLKDAEAAYALKILKLVGAPNTHLLAVFFCNSPDAGPLLLSESLPLLKEHPQYYSIVCGMLKNNKFLPSKRKSKLELDELARNNRVNELLDIVHGRIDLLREYPKIKERIQEYAESNDIDYIISVRALGILMDAGTERKYFENLLTSDGIYKEKEQAIHSILNLIDRKH